MTIEHVSVSAYEDAHLLDECLHSVRDVLGDVSIQVVDGRYDTWPEGEANSTDATAGVAADWDADYVAGGPYPREREKHVDRVERAPDGKRVLFLDADERLVSAATQRFDREAILPRIFNVKVYSEGPISRWPRSFYPETVKAINKWDAYLFNDVSAARTDAITIAHRHDLRGRDYREAKYERIKAEGREVRYSDDEERYYAGEFDVDTLECPRCGRDSLVTSPPSDADSDGLTRTLVCLADDGCYRDIVDVHVGPHEYLPGDWQRGLADDPERLQVELVDAGCEWAEGIHLGDSAAPKIHNWLRRHAEVPA